MAEIRKIKVRAKDGASCPIPGQPGIIVKDDQFVNVRDTVHVRRLIREGSLLIEAATPEPVENTEEGGYN